MAKKAKRGKAPNFKPAGKKRGEASGYGQNMSDEQFAITSRYFKEVGSYPKLTLEQERLLTKKIDRHIRKCISTVCELVLIAKAIVLCITDGKPISTVKKRTCFIDLPKVNRQIRGLHGNQRKSLLLACAKDFSKTFNPEALRGSALKEHLTKFIRSELCGTYLKEYGLPGAKDDFDLMVNSNLRLVVAATRRYHRMSFLDMVQEGNIGLIKAVSRFDPGRKFRFSTYASWWIRHALSRAIDDKSRDVRIPVHTNDAIRKVSLTKKRLIGELGREPSVEELAKETGFPVEKFQMLGRVAQYPISLDQAVLTKNGGGDSTVQDFLVSEEAEDSVTRLTMESNVDLLHMFMRRLKPIEKEVLECRFGLGDRREELLREIGDRHGLSRERIRQLQESALDKIRKYFTCARAEVSQ